jgi:hypothetical protein
MGEDRVAAYRRWFERIGRRQRWLALATLGVGLGVGAGLKAADYQRSPRGAANRSWHGKVTAIDRSGAATASDSGLMARNASGATVPLVVGSEVGAGVRLSTGPRTRARIEFDDGTTMVLDRATELSVAEGPRSLELAAGVLVADVAHIEGAPNAHLVTKQGALSVLGTKFALTAGEDRTSVEVMRGAVELRDGSEAATVSAGQEGVASKGARLEVTPANDLAQRIAFSERLGANPASHNEDADAPVSGLGELRARRPGRTDEKDHAVRLSSHAVKVRIVGNVARTEIDETFSNDTADDLEGLYRFPLPPNAQIERLALEVDHKLVDGSFVDKAKAAAIWRGAIHNAAPQAPKPVEEIVWVPGPWRDPALLEWQRGGRFELKIFPIPKRGSRRIVVAYTETIAPVAGMRRYIYALPQATASDMKIDNFAVDLQVIGSDPKVGVHVRGYELSRVAQAEGPEKLAQTMSDFTPSGDLVVEYALVDRPSEATAWAFNDPAPSSAPSSPVSAKAAGDATADSSDAYVALALRPKLPHWTDTRSRDQVIVVDVGRAMFGERFLRARRLAEQLTEEMDRRDRVNVLACDVTCRSLPGGWKAPGPGAAHDVDAFLAGQAPEGASDLVGAVRAAGATRDRDPQHDLRVVIISDGVASAGYRRMERVAPEVSDALPDGRAEVVTVPIGTDADVATLQEIARGGGGVLVPYAPGEPLETAALDVLNATYGTTLRDPELILPDGLHDIAPSVLRPMRAGGECMVLARMTGDHVKGEAILRGKVGGDPFEARYPLDVRTTSDAGNAFVPRLYAAARIEDRDRDADATPAARAEVVLLSQRFAVPSRFTSLLVLESEAMFQAFGINRDARVATWTGESAAIETASAAKVEAPVGETGAALDRSDPWQSSPGGGGGATGQMWGDSFGAGLGLGGRDMSGPASPARRATPHPVVREASGFESSGADEASKAASAAPPAATATASASSMNKKDAPPQDRAVAPPSPPRQRTGRWMRREWFRRANVSADAAPALGSDKVASVRAALLAAPDERGRYKDLVRVLAVNGALDELEETTTKWAVRDPLDADVTAARADVLARRGDRENALRVLSGIASSSRSMSANDEAAIESALALANERAGKAEACAFRVAAAELKPKDFEAVARAVGCERAGGRAGAADRWLAGIKDDGARGKVAAQAAKLEDALRVSVPPVENVGFGDIVVDARWEGVADADLDLVLVDPGGNRIAWSGRNKGVRVVDPTSKTHEALAVSTSAAGPFTVEVVRSNGGSAPVRGTVTVRSLGSSLTRPFVLTSSRVPVARVSVSWDSRLIPVDSAPNCDPPFFFDASGRKRTRPECL